MLLHLTIVLAVILFVPMFCHKIHIPAIVGFIVVGMVMGPHGMNILAESSAITILGKLGMLYIMFQSGSEIDLNEMKDNRLKAILYGLYSFFIPLLLGIVTSRYILGLEWLTSILLGAMYGSHTLMTYPIVTRYGIQKTSVVNIVIGGSMLSIALSLLVLAWVKAQVQADIATWTYVLWPIFPVLILWAFPKFAHWFLKRYTDPVSDYMLIMLLLLVSALVTELAGMDGILGAFLCGIALNRLLPAQSFLTSRITFVGNSIFVPLFLISVGMMIDMRVFWSGWITICIAIVMIVTKLLGKWLASWLAQVQWHYDPLERQLMFGLTHAAAAGTLAVISIGYQIGVFGSEILNAAVLMILVLCTVSSFVTEHAAKPLALREEARLASDKQEDFWNLVSLTPNDQKLKDLATAAHLHNMQLTTSVTWNKIAEMVEHESASLAVYHEQQPINTISRIVVAVPRYAEKERDFITCFGLVRRLSVELGTKIIFYANKDTEVVLRCMCQRPGKTLHASFREMDDWDDVLLIAKDMREDDMLVLQSSRQSTASYNPLFKEIPSMLSKFFTGYSYLVLYPEQQTGGLDMDTFLMDIPQPSRTWSLLTHVKRWVGCHIHHLQTRQ